MSDSDQQVQVKNSAVDTQVVEFFELLAELAQKYTLEIYEDQQYTNRSDSTK